eukprot:7503497-Alexandrium_andersonii.AAC.1
MNSGKLCLCGVVPSADTPQHSFNNITMREPHALSIVGMLNGSWPCCGGKHALCTWGHGLHVGSKTQVYRQAIPACTFLKDPPSIP